MFTRALERVSSPAREHRRLPRIARAHLLARRCSPPVNTANTRHPTAASVSSAVSTTALTFAARRAAPPRASPLTRPLPLVLTHDTSILRVRYTAENSTAHYSSLQFTTLIVILTVLCRSPAQTSTNCRPPRLPRARQPPHSDRYRSASTEKRRAPAAPARAPTPRGRRSTT